MAYLATPVGTPLTTAIGPTPGRAGTDNAIEVIEATPDAEVVVLYGLVPGESMLPECPGVVVDIDAPRRVVARADGAGRATARIHVPKGLSGKRMFFQAVDLSNCDVTNLVVRTMD